MTEPRQTLSYLRTLLSEHGIRPKTKLGQNFLIDLNLIDLIVREAELTRDDLAFEVGTGTGSLTARLATHAGAVVSVEVDPAFYELAKANLADRDNVCLIHRDILQGKNELAPEVLQALDEQATRFNCTRRKLVANLPYAVAAPLIGNLLVADVPLERMVVTVQWEIAERLMATMGTKAYAALAVFVQSVADVSLLRKLAPSVFWPRPLVDSAIVKIVPNAQKRAQVGDVPRFRVFLRDLYVHRRKNLRAALTGWPGGRRDKNEVEARLNELGIDGNWRAEQLTIEQHQRLFRVFG